MTIEHPVGAAARLTKAIITNSDMVSANPLSERPLVTVVVPARNEEAALGACLESLLAQTGVTFEVVVVDDASTDRTRQIAQSFPAVRIVDAGPLLAGWTGKNNAVTTGARLARSKWLLFTDADTVHKPGSLARAVAEAQQHGAALLSYSPEQEVHGFWEKAVMPVIFAELAATYRPSQVSDAASPAAAANGQYLLITRKAYDAVGGHAAVAGNLLEDVELARLVKASGRKIFFRYGGDAVRTRMYRNFAQLREGWTKNLALLFPSPVRLVALRLTEFVLIVGSGVIALMEAFGGRWKAAAIAAILCVALYTPLAVRIRKAHFPSYAMALSGLPVFSYLLLSSALSHRNGDVAWKGRSYVAQEERVGADALVRPVERSSTWTRA